MTHSIDNPFGLRADVPHIHEYFGVWCMHMPTLTAIANQVQGMDLTAHIRTHQPESGAFQVCRSGDIKLAV